MEIMERKILGGLGVFFEGICLVLRCIFDTVGVQNRPPQFVPPLQENSFELKAI